MNNFNFLAPVYDVLAQVVFGQTLYKASIHFLENIPPNFKVLILGGGTGTLLPELRKCEVIYVEKSTRMLQKAMRRKGIGPVDFIHADFLEWQTNQQFDVVICPFFLDVFTETNLQRVIQKIRELTVKEGQLIVTDFQDTSRFYHRVLLQVMHWFFRFFSGLEGRALCPIDDRIKQNHYDLKHKATFKQEFIFSAVYQRL